ncbi:transcriptional regulator [Streptomyces rochei]|uniref:transcriptional regulator n=1 Tax=Streptomyces rochei TaxID=1928 RepID=UPI0033B9FCEF
MAELRAQLSAALAERGLNKTQLARRAGLGRTVVSGAFSALAPVPTAQTVGALGKALGLEVRSLLDLREIAAGQNMTPATSGEGAGSRGVGRLIAACDPHDLEVHPAIDGPPVAGQRGGAYERGRPQTPLPTYIRRPHDAALARIVSMAAGGQSQMAVLVGASSTGKTRACWEAVQPLASQGWRLWHPIDPTRAEAALAGIERVGAHTVVWLNEAQHYLGAGQGLGERITAALRTLLADPKRSPVLILGTLWHEYAQAYTTLPEPGRRDPHSQTRALLAGRRIELPDSFDAAAVAAARSAAQAGDRQLSHALGHTEDGRLAQFLAGAPELLHRYHSATPAARAVLHAVMDALRFDAGPHLPASFVEHAAQDYLSDDEFDALEDEWFEQALAEVGSPVHGNFAPLRRVRHRPARRTPAANPTEQPKVEVYRLADYLEQHGRNERQALCPPASFWDAACTHLTRVDDLARLADAAQSRLRMTWARALYQRAAEAGDTNALVQLYELRVLAEDGQGAAAVLQQAAEAGNTDAMGRLAQVRQAEGDHLSAETWYRRAADAGESYALLGRAECRQAAGDHSEAERLYRLAHDAGHVDALTSLAEMLDTAGKNDAALHLAVEAAGEGNTKVLARLAILRHEREDHEHAASLARQAAAAGDDLALLSLANAREADRDRDGAEALLAESIAAGSVSALIGLAHRRRMAGDAERAEMLYQKLLLTPGGYVEALAGLARLLESVGRREEAEACAWLAADCNDTYTLIELAHMREEAGDMNGAETLYRQSADAGHEHTVVYLVELLERQGRHGEAEKLAREAADQGDGYALVTLSEMRQETQGPVPVLEFGLDPDGTIITDSCKEDDLLTYPRNSQFEAPEGLW